MMDISELLVFAAEKRASDLILTAGSPPILRIDGEMRSISLDALDPDQTRQLVYDILTDDQIARFESDLELDFSFEVSDTERFRGNAFFQRGQVTSVFRLIPNRVPTLEELGLPTVLEDLAMATRGYSERLESTDQEYAMACKRAGTDSITFLVCGGGKQVEARCRERGWVWIGEQQTNAKKEQENV